MLGLFSTVSNVVYFPVNKAFVLKYTVVLAKMEEKGGRLVYVSVLMIWI